MLRTFQDFVSNLFNAGRYKTHHQAVIVACFFNPQNSPYRLLAFQKWYRSIKHLNHRIIECTIGDTKPQLPDSPYISRVQTDSLLWHKESLLNKLIRELPEEFRYVFWLDTDVLFSNPAWLVNCVERMQQGANLVQPFEYCVHLEKNQLKPAFDMSAIRRGSWHSWMDNPKLRPEFVWRSFCANAVDFTRFADNKNYDIHGHVGFAWGARREILDAMPLYDRALIGGADHIIAHAAMGQIPHPCIINSFTDVIDEVNAWSNKFYELVRGKIGFATGDLYHIWHGDVAKREYLRRIKEFTPQTKDICERDANGLWKEKNKKYVREYFQRREAVDLDYEGFDGGFAEDMGYALADLMSVLPALTYQESLPMVEPVQTIDPPQYQQQPEVEYDNSPQYQPDIPTPEPVVNPDQGIDNGMSGNFS